MVEIKATHKYPIPLGRTGENEAARIAFTLAPFEEVFPGGTPALLVKRKGDSAAYPVTLTVEGLTAYWTVTSADTDKAGFGQCELQWHLGDTLAKSNKFDFIVVPALEAGAEPPDEPSKRWFDAIQAQIGDLSKLTTKAKDNLVAAINEAARAGGGSGGAGTIDMRVADGYIQYSNDDGTTWENLIAVDDLKGADGKDGTDGAPGAAGKDGVTPDIQIGKVTTLPAGSPATASMGGTAANPTLNLGIPKGADGDGANVTKDAVVGALGFTPISADDVPVKKVNGATGEVKSTFYVTVTQGDNGSVTADKTAAEVYAAYEAGYAVYAIAKFSASSAPYVLPLAFAQSVSGAVTLGFATIGSGNPEQRPTYLVVVCTGFAWFAWDGTLARIQDIPTIPTALKNPNALNIKIGNSTTSYDGSAAKTVEIPEGTDGYSPSASVEQTDTGATITITDKSGTTTATVKNGEKGATGETGPQGATGPQGPAGDDYVLTSEDKTQIAEAVIADGQEVQLGGDVPAPTDAQVSSAVSTWLTDHPEATTTVQDGSVSVEKLGYGKHIYGSKPYFCGAVGSGAIQWGSIGVVVPCKAGDTIYCNFNMSTNGAYQKPQLLAALPENQYGAISPIGTIEKDDTTKVYTVPESEATVKAMYLPQNFTYIPAANNKSVADAVTWINNTMGTDGRLCAQNVPFEDYDAWYQTEQTELFDIDENCNKLMFASLYQAVSKLVGAKVAVLGDSLTEQSACSFITSAYNDRWMENVLRDTTLTGDDGKTYKGSGWFALIARKYKIKWWCAGHGMQWWYSTTARPNGATAMVRKLIDGTDEFDYIILEYGTNDILSGYTHIGTAADEASETATTSCGAIKWCIEQMQTRFPEASIVVILPNIRSGANGEPPAAQQTYLDTVIPLLKKYSVRYVNMAEDSGIVKSMMNSDGVHLRLPVVSNNITYYTNDTPAVRKYSKCLESVLLQA